MSHLRNHATCQAWIWDGLQGVLLGRSSLGQGVFPKLSLSNPCKVDELVKDEDLVGMSFMTYKGL
jgi:hypothetical protein